MDTVCVSNFSEDDLLLKNKKINLHVIQSANIQFTIIGLSFVSYSMHDLLSKPDKDAF